MNPILVIYRLIALLVIIGFMAAATAIMMAGWLAVILFGLLAPGWTVRRACDGFAQFIQEAVAQVDALRRR